MTAPAPPAALCASFIGARVLRVTLVDACGRPIWGPRSQVTTEGFVSIEIAPEVEEGDAMKVKTAGGVLCVNERGADQVSWYNLTIDFCQVDPDLFLMMQRTWKRVTDASRQTTTGWRQGEKMSDSLGYALEVWPKASGKGAGQACLLGGGVSDPTLVPGGYFALPWVLGLAPEALTLENAPTSFKQKGRTKPGSLWGRGPYNVTRDLDGDPARLLDPIDPGFSVPIWTPPYMTSGDPDHLHAEIVTLAPPVPTCGAAPVWNPDAVVPLLAVAPGANTRTAQLTVTNFALIGSSGTVNWGDGSMEPMPGSSAGVLSHAYLPAHDGTAQTITFYAGNGHAPVTIAFTPVAP